MIVDFSLSKKIYPIFIHLKDRGTVFPKRRKTLLRTVRIFRSLIYPFFQVYKLFRSAINRLNINLQLQLRLLFGSWHIFTKNRFVISCHWPRFTQLIGTYLVLYHWFLSIEFVTIYRVIKRDIYFMRAHIFFGIWYYASRLDSLMRVVHVSRVSRGYVSNDRQLWRY